MDNTRQRAHGAQPPPGDDRGHPQPRRTTPETSVTLRHHRISRDATRKHSPAVDATAGVISATRRDSSDESHDTAASDPRGWFNRSNRNPKVTPFETQAMDVDPPFFQKETDSSNEELREADALCDPAYPFGPGARQLTHMRPTVTHSSSADDYRSVIDDLTIENKRLKEELKRYKQFGPDMMKKDKLFEIKVHGLPKRKKRELEATLREFAASLGGSSESPPQRKKQSRTGKGIYSSGESMSKHASSSSSRSRPVDSAYASMSTGPSSHAPNSSKASLGRPSIGSRARTSEQKVQDYLRDTPDGLFPRHLVMTEKEKKKLVVRRLEQLFTGKMGGKGTTQGQQPITADVKSASDTTLAMAPPPNTEASREARIQPNDPSRKKTRSRDNASLSNSNGDQTESGGHGQGSGDGGGSGGRTGHTTSPPTAPLPEQRPTRPKDLDPDRTQVPSENMEYIRHLGLVHPQFLPSSELNLINVSPDADGWVYLNLLCNLAQLHMLNVTPNFIRAAVTEKSTRFQLSPDGRKIRWRGGTNGTKFSSDSSGDNSQKSASTDETDDSNGSPKRKRTKIAGGATLSGHSSKDSKFGPHASASSDSFHYKPMFVQQTSSMETSLEGTGSPGSDGAVDESNPGNASRWDYSGSGSSQRKRRRHDGAIVYYSGAPFCIDLSGDPGDLSPTTYMTSTGQEAESVEIPMRAAVVRTLSGSSLPLRPLSDPPAAVAEALDLSAESTPELLEDDESSSNDELLEFPWCDAPEAVQLGPLEPPLEACGLGGVLPEDHFAVIVTTRRPIGTARGDLRQTRRSTSVESAEAVIHRLATMSTSSPHPTPGTTAVESQIEIGYLTAKFKRLRPVQLPPPAIFFPPFSTDSDDDSDDDLLDSDEEVESEEDSETSEALISLRANPHLSDNTDADHDQLMSDANEDEMPVRANMQSEKNALNKPLRTVMVPGTGAGRPELLQTGSSVATAGGAESGYSSSMEEDA
ncbi:putative frequency clock protein [Echria macrotheca]|uniref:Frequency clock protein n=1 Tax=Echria macrotheca TaxID=438768 RepID=A0AAJ0B7H1_9PEZI|nr:putative frequency clock protein [Echria macrotheca]